jgi:pilus assembly protein CpaF
MMLMSGIQLDALELQKIIAKAIDLIVHIELFMDGRRRVTSVAQVYYDEDKGRVIVKDIFCYKQTGVQESGQLVGHWQHDKTKPRFMDKFYKRMVKLPEGFFND